ncbi:MAG: TetR/AcrR family transcriptional regulator [Pseudomonadota bacterium]
MLRIKKKPGNYHHGDLRRVLLETAVRVVEKEGVAGLNLKAVADRAGVSTGAPYHHFQSRELLLAAIAEQGLTLLVQEMQRSAEAASPEADVQLEAMGRGYIRFAIGHRGHFRVMFLSELRPLIAEEVHGAGLAMLKRAIIRCQEVGLAPPGDPAPLVLTAWSAVHGASNLWINGSLADKQLVKDGEVLASTVAAMTVKLIAAGGRPVTPLQPGRGSR